VSRREAPLGIVYATDAAGDPRVRIAGVFPGDTYPPIIYPAALMADSKNPATARLLEFLASQAPRPLFEKRGFSVLRQNARRCWQPLQRWRRPSAAG